MKNLHYTEFRYDGAFYDIKEALEIYENIIEGEDVDENFYEQLENGLGFDPEENWLTYDEFAEDEYERYFKGADIQGIPHHGNTSYWVPKGTAHFSEIYVREMKRMDLDICEYNYFDIEDFESEELKSWYFNWRPVSFKEAAWLVNEREDIPERMEAELMDEVGLDGKADEKIALIFTRVGLSVHNMHDMHLLHDPKDELEKVIKYAEKEIVEWMDKDGVIDNSDCIESLPILYSRKVPEKYSDVVINRLEEFLKGNYNQISRLEPSGDYICFYYPKDEYYKSIEELIKEKKIILDGRDNFNIADEIEPQM